MPQQVYQVHNGSAQTSAVPTAIAVTTSPKTHIQLYHATNPISVTEWGVSFDQITAGTPIVCELLSYTVGATVTAFATADVTLFTDPTATMPGIGLSTVTSGYGASSEGVTGTARVGDVQKVAPTNQYLKQFPLGQEFVVPAANYLRVRVTGSTGATPNAYSYVNFSIG